MTLKNLYYKSCCVMQWNIGFGIYNIKDIIRERRNNMTFKWLPVSGKSKSFADPFIFKTDEDTLNLIYEDFSMIDSKCYGKIALSVLDKNFKPVFNKQILDSKTHSSYPFVYKENDKIYIIPESSKKGKVISFEYDLNSRSLTNEKNIIDNLPLLDSTIYKHNGTYWLFATLSDHQFDHSKLYIYYADSLFGNYKPHMNNPVKFGLEGSRPAGNIIEVDNELYRPAQNCSEYYGKSITINKITKLSIFEFLEEPYMEITADKNSEYSEGLHTINSLNDIVVVDGIKMVFMPIKKIKMYFKKRSLIKK